MSVVNVVDDTNACAHLLYSSDFENKFVCGEIMSYEDLKELGSETAVKAAGKLRQQGKPYESESHVKLVGSLSDYHY